MSDKNSCEGKSNCWDREYGKDNQDNDLLIMLFLYDPCWNEAVENQAIDRAHRIGRKDTVIAKRYVAVERLKKK